MSKFSNVFFNVSDQDGVFSLPIDNSHMDAPVGFYEDRGRNSDLARLRWHRQPYGISWEFNGEKKYINFQNSASVAFDDACDLLVVVEKITYDDIFVRNDSYAVCPDATVDHKIKHPKYVFKGDYVPDIGWVEPLHDGGMEVSFPPGSDTWVGVEVPGAGVCYRVEEISHVRIKSGRLVIGLRFGYDWCEERFYDAGKRLWLERAGVYPFGMRG